MDWIGSLFGDVSESEAWILLGLLLLVVVGVYWLVLRRR